MQASNRIENNFVKLKRNWFIITVIVLCLIKQLIVVALPVYARDANGPDQYKLLTDAEKIYKGEYLTSSEYDVNALFKRAISFPIFLASCHKLGVSYLSGYTLLYTMSSLLALYTFKQFAQSKKLVLAAFLIVLFCPFSYDPVVQLIYNLSFTAPLAIAAISCLILVYISETRKKMLGWSLLASFNLIAIWLNREDSMWILPLIICYLFVMSVKNSKNKDRDIAKALITILPVIVIILGNTALSWANYIKFGIFTTNDYTSTNFEAAYNDLLKIEQDYFPESCSITRGTLEKAYAVSPSLRELKPYMDEFYENGNGEESGRNPSDGEVEDGWMNMNLRVAASRCGYYEDAVITNEFWGRVCEELEKAFEEGKVNTRNITFFGSVLHHPWRSGAGYTLKWLNSAGNLIKEDILHTLAVPQMSYNSVGEEMTARYEAMTLNYTVDKPKYTINLSGWVLPISSTDEYILRIVDQNGNVVSQVERIDSPDIANIYSDVIPNASSCRFVTSFETIDEKIELFIEVIENNHIKKKFACENGIEYEDLVYHIDLLEKICKTDMDEAYAKERLSIAASVARLYKFLGPFEAVLFIMGYIYITWKMILSLKNRKNMYLNEWIFLTTILGCILILLAAISFIDAFMWGALGYTHTIGTLIDFGGAAAIVIDGNVVHKKINYKRSNNF